MSRAKKGPRIFPPHAARLAWVAGIILCGGASPAQAHGLTDCDGKALPDQTVVSEEDVLVCTVTINSHDEKDTFHKRVCGEGKGGKHYKFLELTEVGTGEDWFKSSCAEANRQKAKRSRGCEVLLVSGHFAGKYFFGESGKQLTTDELETASCNKSCEGVLRDPTEVFLFGCNTLAGKTSRADNVELMGQRLRGDGVSEADIEEIVQGRFGDLGDSNKERMRRAFSGVPNLYGYNDVGPLGATVKVAFDSYLAEAEKGGKTYRDWLTERQLKPVTNIALTQALKAFPIEMTCGTPQDGDSPETVTRKVICALSDTNAPIAARLDLLRTVIKGEADFMRYLPSMQKFFDAESPAYVTKEDEDAFAALKFSLNPVADSIVARVESDRMKAYPQLRYDLGTLAYTLGWGPRMKIKTQGDFDAVTTAELLRTGQISGASSKLVCNKIVGYERSQLEEPPSPLSWSTLKLKASDVDASVYTEVPGLRAISCLRPLDPEVQLKVAKTLTQIDRPTRETAVLTAFGIDVRYLSAQAAVLVFKRLLSIKPQPVLDAKVLVELAHQFKKADKDPRASGFEIFKMLKPAPTDPAVVKEICAIPGAGTSLTFCAAPSK